MSFADKLQMCREEREKIAAEEKKATKNVSPVVAQSAEHMNKAVTLSGKSTVREQRIYSGINTC